jgi:hypothetical protein
MSTTGQWDALFKDRHWRVAEELSGGALVSPGRKQPQVRVTFDRGTFEIDPPGAYRSPLSTNLGRRGVVLQETDAAGEADIEGSRITVGPGSLQRAREQYAAIW